MRLCGSRGILTPPTFVGAVYIFCLVRAGGTVYRDRQFLGITRWKHPWIIVAGDFRQRTGVADDERYTRRHRFCHHETKSLGRHRGADEEVDRCEEIRRGHPTGHIHQVRDRLERFLDRFLFIGADKSRLPGK